MRCTTSPRGTRRRWVALGGGGYAVLDVVPRAWTHLHAAIAAHRPIPVTAAVPEDWREHVRERAGRPRSVPDGRPVPGRGPVVVALLGLGYDPEDPG